MAAYLSSVSTVDGLLHYSCAGRGTRDYWNIDDIIAEEEAVPCNFNHDAKGLAYLDSLDQPAAK
jgi:hypothetical protein